MSKIPKAAIEAGARAVCVYNGEDESNWHLWVDEVTATVTAAVEHLTPAGGLTQVESSGVTPRLTDADALAAFARVAEGRCGEASCDLPGIHTGQHRSASQAERDVRLTPAQQKVAQHLGERVLDLPQEQRPDIEGLRCYSCGHEFSGRRWSIDTTCPECGSDSFSRRQDATELTPALDAPADDATELASALGEVIWNTSRNDEGTISATGANHLANAVLSSGLVVPVGDRDEALIGVKHYSDLWYHAMSQRDAALAAVERAGADALRAAAVEVIPERYRDDPEACGTIYDPWDVADWLNARATNLAAALDTTPRA